MTLTRPPTRVEILLELFEAFADRGAVRVEQGLQRLRIAHQQVGGREHGAGLPDEERGAAAFGLREARSIPGEALCPAGLGEIDAAHEVEERVLAPGRIGKARIAVARCRGRTLRHFLQRRGLPAEKIELGFLESFGLFRIRLGQRLEGGSGGFEFELARRGRAGQPGDVRKFTREVGDLLAKALEGRVRTAGRRAVRCVAFWRFASVSGHCCPTKCPVWPAVWT